MLTFPDSECIVGVDILSNWQNFYSGSLACGMKIVVIEMAREALELLLLPK